MKTVKAKNALRAVLTAWALFVDLNLRSGNNYVNLGESLTGTSGAVALAAMAGFLALEWADEKLTRSSGRVKLAALMMGAWQVVAVSVSNTDSLNQPFLSGSQTLKAVVLALGMASLFELFFRLLEAGLDGRLDVRPAKNGALLSAYRAHTMLFCTAVVLLCWLPHLAVSYPVAMNSDTASQFRQALGWEPWNADHPTFGTALIKLCIGAGRLLGSGNLGVFLYILAQAVFGAAVVGYSQMLMRRLCAGLAEGAFAGGVRAGHGILRQHHGHSQGCAVQLRHVADALRNGARPVSGRRVLFRQPGFCAAQDPQQRTAHLDSRWDRADLPGGQKPSKGRRRRGLYGGCAADAAGRGI